MISDRIVMETKFYETVLSLSPKEKSSFVILDIASGQGSLLRRIRAKYPRSCIYGIDFSK
jgi:ubiquinone/menaquinone biosynthesis C-methylase UbiE